MVQPPKRWRTILRLAAAGTLLAAIFNCGAIVPAAPPAGAAWRCEEPVAECRSIYVVSDRWHAGIVLRRDQVSVLSVPEIGDFSELEKIEFSWGDRDYFPDPDPGIAAALRAAFWSRGSVLHVVGFNGAVDIFYRGATVKELRLDPLAFERLIAFIAKTFHRPDSLAAVPRPGLFAYSRFYAATGKFSIARTCNTWVAEALYHAGLPLDTSSVITSGQLNTRIAEFAVRP